MGCLQVFNVLMNPLRVWYAVMCVTIYIPHAIPKSHHLISNHHIWLSMIQQS